MDELIRQIRAATTAGLHYLALFGALVLPDICGALASDNGTASGPKYKDWLRANVPGQAADADLVWGLRCSLLHQGRAMPHGSMFSMAFTFPNSLAPELHNLSTVVDGQQVAWTSVPALVNEITIGAEKWLEQYGSTARVQNNLEKFARYRPEGIPTHYGGPVIA